MEAFKKLNEEVASAIEAQMKSAEFSALIDKIKSANGEDTGTFEVVISTMDQDRHGEVVDQNGIDTVRYMQNPVVLWGHDYWALPIGVTEEIVTENGRTIARGKFASEEANPFAQQVRRLYDLKIVRATSVGFIPKEYNGNIITKCELLEFSFVAVPANPFALSLRDATGLNTDMLKMKGIEISVKEEEEQPVIPGEEESEEAPEEGGSDEKSIKSGRVLSEQNRSLINDAIESLKGAVVALEGLLTATNPEGDEGNKAADGGAPKQRSSGAGLTGKDLDNWIFTQGVLRAVNTATSEALALMKKRR